jgi:CheY-like chemotaxis protein
VVSVRDTGVGIPAVMLPRVFELFAQVDNSTSREEGGLGIGLALVRGLVHLHGGRVEARSDGRGQGSEFLVHLPRAAARPIDGAPLQGESSTLSSAQRLLVVDDNRDAAATMAMLLEITGHATRTAHDGRQALVEAQAYKPDAVLLDIGLPLLSGHEVARRLRSEPWGRDLVLVALTGWGQDPDRQASQDAGFDAHMVKPVDHEALLRLLQTLLEQRRARVQAAS